MQCYYGSVPIVVYYRFYANQNGQNKIIWMLPCLDGLPFSIACGHRYEILKCDKDWKAFSTSVV